MSYYVTTPIYYVNAEPHLGHAYSTLAADILARHMRQRGEDVFFLTGTDEHGEPIENAAERAGVTPQELADRNAAKFEALMPIIDATNDFFIRTSDPRHANKVAEIMQRVYDNGWVSKGTYEGWYCPRCADFKTERELGPGQSCPIHEIPLEKVREENWFFRLSAFQERLEALYAERPDFVVPDFRRNEAVSFIEGGLEDVSLSRPKLKWGMRLPWDPEQRMYVWFDALLNYVTALTFAREGEDLTERFWPASLHVMAKDILKFHAVIWPALLWAADLEPPQRMAIHGYLLMGEKKMSKSLGNVLDPFEAIDRFGADALRFYCFREVSFGQDGSISTAGFEARYETELANDFGNLASRVLAMVDRYRDGVVPVAQVDAVLEEDFEGVVERFSGLLDRAELTQALEEAWKLVRRLNRYVEETRPWELAKDEADPERLDEVLYNLAEGLRVTTLLLVPYLPRTSEQLLAALGEDSRELSDLGSRPGGQTHRAGPAALPQDRDARLGERVGAELVRAGVAAEGHRQVELGEDHLQHRLDARLSAERQAPDVGAAEADGVGAEGERLEHVGAAADAAVEEDRQLVADRLGDRRQGVERGDRAVDLAAAVVGDDDAVDPRAAPPRGRRRRAGCP